MRKYFMSLGLFLLFVSSIYAASDWTIQSGTNYITENDQYYNVWVNNSAVLNMSGGYTTYIYTNNSSTLHITGGKIFKVESQGNSITSISDGDVAKIYCYDTSVLNVYGWQNGLGLSDSPLIVASGHSVVNIFQGNARGQLNAYDNSIVHIYGKNFNFQSNFLTGTWVNGTDFSLYMRGQFELPSQIVFHEIPEPTSAAVMILGALWMVAKHRR